VCEVAPICSVNPALQSFAKVQAPRGRRASSCCDAPRGDDPNVPRPSRRRSRSSVGDQATPSHHRGVVGRACHAARARDARREIVLWSTPSTRATSACGLPPSSSSSAWARWCALSFGLRPKRTALRPGAVAPGRRARPDQLPFELGQPGEHGHHQPAMRVAGVSPAVG
jgi:hypothetical protein